MFGRSGIFRVGSGRVLGLSVSDRVVQAAEVSLSDEKVVVHRVGEMELGDVGSQDSAGLRPAAKRVEGLELVKFLREKGFTARRVVIGLPARWLLVRGRTLPAMDEQTMAQTLRLQVEHDFAPSSRELVFDFIASEGASGGAKPASGSAKPASGPGKSANVLVVATLAERVRQVVSAAESAGLEVLAVTSAVSAVAALGPMVNGRLGDGVTLHIGRTGSELMVRGSAGQMIRHVGGESSSVPGMANEVRRVLSQVGLGEAVAEATTPRRRIMLWDGLDLSGDQVSELSSAIGAQVEVADPGGGGGRIDANGVGRVEMRRYVGAIALGRLGFIGKQERGAEFLDFLHSRLAEPKKARVSRRAMVAAGVGLVVLGLVGYVGFDVMTERQELTEMQARLKVMEPDIEATSMLAEEVRFVGQWFGNRPKYLDCLRELTLALPNNPPVWVTNLTLYENRPGLVAGRTTEQRAALMLLDRLQETGRFSNLQMLDMREAGRGGAEVSFSISFRFQGSGFRVEESEEGGEAVRRERSEARVGGLTLPQPLPEREGGNRAEANRAGAASEFDGETLPQPLPEREGGNSAGLRPAANRDEEGMP